MPGRRRQRRRTSACALFFCAGWRWSYLIAFLSFWMQMDGLIAAENRPGQRVHGGGEDGVAQGHAAGSVSPSADAACGRQRRALHCNAACVVGSVLAGRVALRADVWLWRCLFSLVRFSRSSNFQWKGLLLDEDFWPFSRAVAWRERPRAAPPPRPGGLAAGCSSADV